MNRRTFIAGLGAILACTHAEGGRITVGIEARHLYRCEVPIRARTVTGAGEPLIIRIDSQTRDGNATIYDLRAIAFVPGVHDLRTALERIDGAPTDTLPPASIEVFGVLPKGHRGVSAIDDPPAPRMAGYRAALIALGVCWALPAVLLVARRALRRRPGQELAPVTPPPTFADQLRPLVRAAMEGRATLEERVRLERLLLAHWRQHLDLATLSAHDALARMTAHEDAGAILRAVQRWLYAPQPDAMSPDEHLASLLKPYLAAPAVDPGAAQEVELKPLPLNTPRAGQEGR